MGHGDGGGDDGRGDDGGEAKADDPAEDVTTEQDLNNMFLLATGLRPGDFVSPTSAGSAGKARWKMWRSRSASASLLTTDRQAGRARASSSKLPGTVRGVCSERSGTAFLATLFGTFRSTCSGGGPH